MENIENIVTQVVPQKKLVDKVKSILSDKKKVVIIFFVLFALAVAIQTLISELKPQKTAAPTAVTTPTPIPSLNEIPENSNSNIQNVNESTNKYENTLYGFSFEYPSYAGLVNESAIGSAMAETVYVTIENLNDPSSVNANTLKDDRRILASGEFGLETIPVKYFLKGVVKKDSSNVKIYTNLEGLECSSVELNRSATFYRFDRKITLTLSGPVERLIKDNPNYFVSGSGDCESETVWSSIGQESFIFSLTNRTAQNYALAWQDDFSKIISTLKISNPTDRELFTGSVKGRWQGDKMVVILVANNKLGFITEMKLWYSDNEENDWEAFNTFKMVPSKDKIRVRYKDQYGNISQVFSASVEFK